jgi:hypothetical protein
MRREEEMTPVIDVQEVLASRGRINLNISSEESPEERAARLEREKLDAALRRRKEGGVLVLAAVAFSALLVLSLYASFWGAEEEKKWGTSLLSAIGATIVGYLWGQRK